jgi:hypothetical protein
MAELTAVMAGFSWFFMVRNGIRTLYEDTYTWETFERTWIDISNRLDIRQNALQTWQEKWMFHKGIPDSMFVDFWGQNGFDKIKLQLFSARENAGELRRYIEKMGFSYNAEEYPTKHQEQQEFEEIARENDGDIIERETGKWTRKRGSSRLKYWLRKVEFVLATKTKFVQLAEQLMSNIATLDDLATASWKTRGLALGDTRPDRPDNNAIYHHGIRTALSCFAPKTQLWADELYNTYSQESTLLSMALNILRVDSDEICEPSGKEGRGDNDRARASKHMQAVAIACKLCIPDLVTLVRDEQDNHRVVAKEIPSGNKDGSVPPKVAFTNAAKDAKTTTFRIQTGSNSKYFIVSHDGSVQYHPKTRSTVLQLLSGELASAPRQPEVLQVIKLKLAYELSLAYFMFYRSLWSSMVCISSLGLAVMNGGGGWNEPKSYEFTISTAHLCTDEKDAATQNQCLGAGFPNLSDLQPGDATTPLRRLGLLLIQIAGNGSTVDIIKMKNGSVSKLKVRNVVYDLEKQEKTTHGSDSSQDSREENYYALVDYIKGGFGNMERVGEAVLFCLRDPLGNSRNPNDDGMTKGLQVFYRRVVQV